MSEAKWNQKQGGYNDHKMVRESSVTIKVSWPTVTFDNGKYRLCVFLGARMMSSRLVCYYSTFREKERGSRESKRVREKRQRHRDRQMQRDNNSDINHCSWKSQYLTQLLDLSQVIDPEFIEWEAEYCDTTRIYSNHPLVLPKKTFIIFLWKLYIGKERTSRLFKSY